MKFEASKEFMENLSLQPSRGRIRDTSNLRKIHFGGGFT